MNRIKIQSLISTPCKPLACNNGAATSALKIYLEHRSKGVPRDQIFSPGKNTDYMERVFQEQRIKHSKKQTIEPTQNVT